MGTAGVASALLPGVPVAPAMLASGSAPGPASYAGTLAVAAGCGLLGLLLAGRVAPRPGG
ncbi:hypothetical protein AB0H28_18050 [Micromonospora sp. NPDC050980]|uniref:hypothetical protein n=1 Tax=Micromonospora sp. NPDC050980 TaxID=3155161 RepID=UPI0033E35E08